MSILEGLGRKIEDDRGSNLKGFGDIFGAFSGGSRSGGSDIPGGNGKSGGNDLGGSGDVPGIMTIVSTLLRGLGGFFGGGSGGSASGCAQMLEVTMEDSEGELEEYA